MPPTTWRRTRLQIAAVCLLLLLAADGFAAPEITAVAPGETRAGDVLVLTGSAARSGESNCLDQA